jgi:PAS domain S-box-containing protein
MTSGVLEIPDSKLAQHRLPLYQFSVEHAADAIFWVASDARLTFVNEQAVRSLGYAREELLAMRVHDIDPLYPRENWGTVWRELRQQGFMAVESVHRRRDGSEFPVWVHASYYRDDDIELSFACCRDISEKRASEKALQQAHRDELAHVGRLATTGELAAGLAHELNQPLYAVNNFAQGALRRLEAGSLDRDSLMGVLQDIAHESQRAAEVIRSLRRYVAKRAPERGVTNINELVRGVVRLVAAEADRRQVIIEARLADALPPIHCDAIQIKQVLVNLILNAMEAMAESPSSERRLTIISQRTATGVVRLAVSDRGPGLSTGEVDRVFDAFYTTKQEGIGLGLTISRTIVQSHGGRLDVATNPDRGVTFTFELPIFRGEL